MVARTIFRDLGYFGYKLNIYFVDSKAINRRTVKNKYLCSSVDISTPTLNSEDLFFFSRENAAVFFFWWLHNPGHAKIFFYILL